MKKLLEATGGFLGYVLTLAAFLFIWAVVYEEAGKMGIPRLISAGDLSVGTIYNNSPVGLTLGWIAGLLAAPIMAILFSVAHAVAFGRPPPGPRRLLMVLLGGYVFVAMGVMGEALYKCSRGCDSFEVGVLSVIALTIFLAIWKTIHYWRMA